MSQLSSDCLNDIFEYLEDDKVTLRSCVLVNRLWCEVSVRILWRSIRNYNTLIACLPNYSKEILSKNGIVTSTSASRPPMFNYASFCKVLSTYEVIYNIKQFLNQQYILPQNSSDELSIFAREIFKFLMNQISLRKLYFYYSQNEITSDGLADLISAQRNLKFLNMNLDGGLTADIITSLTNLPNSLIKLDFRGYGRNIPLSFISKLTSLQEIILSFQIDLENFKELQYVIFPHLQVLKFPYKCPRDESLIKFLENNGNNLKEIYIDSINNSINLAIAEFCPNLRKLFTGFKENEIETLKMILNNCQYLESIKVWCCEYYLDEKELFEVFVKYSPENFHELKLCYYSFEFDIESELLPEELESFLISWSNRIPEKSLSLITIRNKSNRTLDEIDDNMEIIEEYTDLGIIKEFRSMKHYLDDFEY